MPLACAVRASNAHPDGLPFACNKRNNRQERRPSCYHKKQVTFKEEIMKLHKDYEKYIQHSKEGALQLIADITLDYDGYDTVPKLKWLIDELRAIALLGLKQKAGNIS